MSFATWQQFMGQMKALAYDASEEGKGHPWGVFLGLPINIDDTIPDEQVDILSLPPDEVMRNVAQRSALDWALGVADLVNQGCPNPLKDGRTSIALQRKPPPQPYPGDTPYQREVNRWFATEASDQERELRQMVEGLRLTWWDLEEKVLRMPWAQYTFFKRGTVWTARRQLATYCEIVEARRCVRCDSSVSIADAAQMLEDTDLCGKCWNDDRRGDVGEL